jgi:hypothetical protein
MKIKKTIKSPLVMLAIGLLISGSFYLIIKFAGYTYVHSIFSLIAMPLIIVLLTSTALVLRNKNEKTKLYIFFAALLPLIAFFHIFSRCVASDVDAISLRYDAAYTFGVFLCGMILFFACVGVRVLRIGLGIVYSIVLVPVLSIILLSMMIFAPQNSSSSSSSSPLESSYSFLATVTKTVVRSELSPNSIFLAEIVDSDAGALGGSTHVYVTRLNSDLNLFIGTLKRDPQWIYRGRWGEFQTMTLRWEGDNMLYINEKQYVVK